MPLSEADVRDRFRQLMNLRSAERHRLDNIREYIRDPDERRVRFLPDGVSPEVRELARISRLNMLRRVVRGAYQMMYVEGYRAPRGDDNLAPWEAWQQNQMDSRQIGVHKAALQYGHSYVSLLPGTTGSVSIRGHSPRNMTCAYGDDDLWPELALERRRTGWWLYDRDAVYPIEGSEHDADAIKIGPAMTHPAGVTPVVRYQDTDDLDDPGTGIVEPLIPLQNQIDITTFGLMVAQHYGAFKQMYIIGWLGKSEVERLRMGASRVMTFEDPKTEIEVGQLQQTDLSGYIASRDSQIKALIAISQASAHELLGQLINLSAEALAAAESSAQRAAGEHRRVMGERHEQTLGLAGKLMGKPPAPDAEVRWADTEIRTLGQVADALGKFADQLGIPTRGLWDRAADALGASDTEVQRWEQLREGDAFQRLLDELDRRAGTPAGGNPNPPPVNAGQP